MPPGVGVHASPTYEAPPEIVTTQFGAFDRVNPRTICAKEPGIKLPVPVVKGKVPENESHTGVEQPPLLLGLVAPVPITVAAPLRRRNGPVPPPA
jgi:hypothetical protein